jgi:uncharacterized Zn-binding protein involved in type VI secretion
MLINAFTMLFSNALFVSDRNGKVVARNGTAVARNGTAVARNGTAVACNGTVVLNGCWFRFT